MYKRYFNHLGVRLFESQGMKGTNPVEGWEWGRPVYWGLLLTAPIALSLGIAGYLALLLQLEWGGPRQIDPSLISMVLGLEPWRRGCSELWISKVLIQGMLI